MEINVPVKASRLRLSIPLFHEKPSSGLVSFTLSRSSLFRSNTSHPFLSSVYCCSDSRPRTPMYATQNSESNYEEAGPSLREEYSGRQSPEEVRKEIINCYKLVDKLGHGAVYFGSARTNIDHSHYLQAKDLARDVALLLDCTSWTGGGPGMMDAATLGALEAKKPVGCFSIAREAGTWVTRYVHPYLATQTYFTCRFFSARKHGLVEAGVRNNVSDRTAFICLPGGMGTLDELFEVVALKQLDRIGSSFPVPFLILNYDNFYTDLLKFLKKCEVWGTVRPGEFESVCHVCNSNLDALEYLADFYGISEPDRFFRQHPQKF